MSRPEGDPYAWPEARRVEAVFTRAGPTVRLVVSGRAIETTAEHPVYVVGKGWRVAAELGRGDVLASHNAAVGVVEAVAACEDVVAVYNLRVADWHTYFVGGEDWGFSVWAHNAEYMVDPTGDWQYRLFHPDGNPVIDLWGVPRPHTVPDVVAVGSMNDVRVLLADRLAAVARNQPIPLSCASTSDSRPVHDTRKRGD